MTTPDHPASSRRVLLRALGFAAVAAIIGCGVIGFTCRPAVDVNTFYPDKGMTMDEVRAKYGPPTESYSRPDGTAAWYYSTDKLGLGVFLVGVTFDASGRVESYFNH